MKPHIVMIDIQNHFIKYQDKYNFSDDLETIINFIDQQRLKNNKLTVVTDQLMLNDFETYKENFTYSNILEEHIVDEIYKEYPYLSSEDGFNEEEYNEIFDQKIEEFIYENSELISQNIPIQLILSLNKQLSSVENIIKKKYAYIRNILEEDIDSSFILMKLKAELIEENLYDEIDFHSDDIFNYIKELLIDNDINNKTINSLLELVEYNGIEDTINQHFDSNYIEYNSINEKYSHIKKDDEILLIGGGACECLLEEYVSLRIGGFHNITLNEDLIYGEKFEFNSKIDSIDRQIDKLHELEKIIKREKEIPLDFSFN